MNELVKINSKCIDAVLYNNEMGTIMMKDIVLKFDKISKVKFFNDCILNGKNNGDTHFDITVLDSGVYSNVCAPIAGIIDHYKGEGIDFTINSSSSDFSLSTYFYEPLTVTANKGVLERPFSKVWKFKDFDDVSDIVNAFLLATRKTDRIEKGVIDAIEWSLNEVMDNVLQHSGKEYGYIMGQIHPKTKVLSFCIFDNGIGIYNSFNDSSLFHPRNAKDAIINAMNEKVTRDNSIGQGNGLWGFSRIISQANGSFSISSCGAKIINNNGTILSINSGDFNLGKQNGTTLIDFQFNYDKTVDVVKALNGYRRTDLWLENLETDNDDIVEITIKDIVKNYGTRKSGQMLRNVIENIVNNDNKKINISFKDINIISSSFADEAIGKLLVNYGFVSFINLFLLTNINDICARIIDRSVEQRMGQMYYSDTKE